MRVPFCCHWVDSHPSKICHKELGTFVSGLRFDIGKHRVSENVMRQPRILQHSIVSGESLQDEQVKARSHSALSCPVNGLLSMGRGQAPPLSKSQMVDWFVDAGPHGTTSNQRVYESMATLLSRITAKLSPCMMSTALEQVVNACITI
jgi:hypothetical protein